MTFRLLTLICLYLSVIFSFSSCAEKKNPEAEKKQNRLAEASSPYLIEHADNPVDWYEWGPEALEKAEKEDKPIIISIGYAACHWCHVMEEETFMDSSVAAVMNKNFISIKVDREERPDIDNIYMNAAQLLNGSGGWPLNAVALPNGKPFFAGTYFSNQDWKNILQEISRAYKENKAELTGTADALTRGIRSVNNLQQLETNTSVFSEEDYVAIIQNWKNAWDPENGGYQGSQKFPLPVAWDALLQYYYLSGDTETMEMLKTTLDHMARGGIYDQLGGGFARYTTDTDWRYPHFEKMLYDNAQLISLYSNAYKITKKEEYKNIVEESIAFVERELSNSEGGFYSSINADSEGEEGKYYVWTSGEIKNNLSPAEAKVILDFYNFENYGNWEKGKNILFRRFSEEEFSEKNGLDHNQFSATLAKAEEKLEKLREKRKKPSIDDKSLTSWNALMTDAYLDAYTALEKEQYLEKALATASFLDKNMWRKDGGLWRNYKNGNKSIRAFLDDYALLGQACLSLYQVTFNLKWLKKAEALTTYSIEKFQDEKSGMFYFTEKEEDGLVVRNMELEDSVLPSSNAVTAGNLLNLGILLENEEYLEMSRTMLSQMQKQLKSGPASYANWIKLLGKNTYGYYEIAIMGEKAVEKNKYLQREYLPVAVFMGGREENLPLLKGKLSPGENLIYVCENRTCKYPVQTVKEALELLQKPVF
ncbi:thioredoxin domain-containing protein [Zunongwangia sp. F363]|uniref:Thioredoxin domain-containing protein n=1 Tax=Autumnicola tepida TaxID=3075595 RepID=A0ABU3C7C4_9FLAO|nr:thioredoxin domain-containing protein [Zunongwangia sp. F363]MDT0642245.1 thioredoxin domain-containing protein [Zunongwangia sp. F363]